MRLRTGMDWELEQQADQLLAKQRRDSGVIEVSQLNDYFSEHQLRTRFEHEVYSPFGVVEETTIHGIFKRAHNPQLGKRRPKRSERPEHAE